jgi:hypothetical protein
MLLTDAEEKDLQAACLARASGHAPWTWNEVEQKVMAMLKLRLSQAGGRARIPLSKNAKRAVTVGGNYPQRTVGGFDVFKKTFLSKQNSDCTWRGKVLKGETTMFGEP